MDQYEAKDPGAHENKHGGGRANHLLQADLNGRTPSFRVSDSEGLQAQTADFPIHETAGKTITEAARGSFNQAAGATLDQTARHSIDQASKDLRSPGRGMV